MATKTKDELIKELIEAGCTIPVEELKENTNAVLEDMLKPPVIEEVYEGKPFVLVVSPIKHDVTKVIDKLKGLSLFKFGRKDKSGKLIPTRLPEKYGNDRLQTYPNKYDEVEVPGDVKDLDTYFAELVQAQDDADNLESEKLEKIAAKKKEARLAELQRTGKAKKIVRE